MPEIVRITGDTEPEIDELSPENVLFGKYEIGRLLGCGAFAKVYHARNIQTSQSVAIKAISKQKIDKGGLVSNIKREISIMHRLRHTHIVKLFEVLATKTKIYFVLEFIKGGELFGKVARGRLSEDLSRQYFQQLISAVGYCHSHGVFHRDLKPENVLIDEFGELKVADFGLSALKEQVGNDGMLHTLCGTPAYVAPELLAKKGYDGGKVDIWSCGIILYVLNAGYLPFNDTNLMKMYKKIYRGEFKSPKWFSPELRQLLSRLLDTNPETRITVNEILHDNWFTNGGYKELEFHDEEDDFLSMKAEKEEKQGFNFLNAFHLISFSSGFDLSGLFNGSNKPDNGERFVSDHSPERIIEKLEDIGKREDITVGWKKGWRIEMQGQKSNFSIRMEVHRLTKNLVVVEVRKYGGDDARSCEEMWTTKIQPQLSNLIHRPGNPVSGESAAA